MDAAQNTLKSIDLLAQVAEGLAQAQRSYLTADGDAPNGKLYRRYNQAEVCEDLGGINTRTLANRVAELGIDPKADGYRWSITLPQLQQLRRHVIKERWIAPLKVSPLVIAIANLKGGAGKTMTAVTSAVGLATQMKSEYRIGLIDLDPQGTGTMYLAPLFDNRTMFTVGDLMTGNYELAEGETFTDLCKNAFLPTNAPNLRVLPASVDDNLVELWMQDKTSKEGQAFNAYSVLSNIIKEVEEDFDIILIDTGPSLDYKVMNALYAANSIIIPVQAHQNDQDATSKYLRSMTRIYERLARAGHPGYDIIKLLNTRFDRRSLPEVEAVQISRQKFGPFMMNAEFVNSEAVKFCSTQLSTIYDFSAHEYPKGKVSLRNAQAEFYKVLSEIESMLLNRWGLLNAPGASIPKTV